jgi:Proline utilization A proline dehydrogenase N-terminal domain
LDAPLIASVDPASLRDAIRQLTRQAEPACVARLLPEARLDPSQAAAT